MPLKPSRAAINRMTELLEQHIAASKKPRVMLQSMDGRMFYLVVGDDVMMWSPNRADVEAALNADQIKFAYSETSHVTPNVRVEYPFVSKPPKPEGMTFVFEARDMFSMPLSTAARAAERREIAAQVERLTRRFGEMLTGLGDNSVGRERRRQRIADLKALNEKLGLRKMNEATTREQVNAYGKLIGSWAMREKAGL